MAEQKVDILKIEVNAEQAVQSMTQIEQELETLKEQQKECEEATKQNASTLQKTNKEYAVRAEKIKLLNAKVREYQKQIQNQVKAQYEDATSLKAMRATLSNLRAEYDGLSQAERENEDVGGALQKQIMELHDALMEAEKATGRYQRNVGNYYEGVMAALEDSMTVWKQWGTGGGQATTEVVQGLGKVQQGLGLLKNAMTMLAAHPIIALIGVLVVILTKVWQQIGKSEELTNRLSVAFAKFQPVLDLITNGLEVLADILVTVIEGLMDGVGALLEFVGATNAAGQSVADYVLQEQERIRIEKEARDAIVSNAIIQNQIAKLKHKIAQEEKSDRAQARKDLLKVNELEKQLAKEEKQRAVDRALWLYTEGQKTMNAAEFEKQYAEAKAEYLRADARYFEKTKENESKLAAFDEEDRKRREEAQKKKEEEAKKRGEQRLKELEAERKFLAEQIKAQIERIKQEQELRKAANEKELKDIEEHYKELSDKYAHYTKQRLERMKLAGATDAQIEAENYRLQGEAIRHRVEANAKEMFVLEKQHQDGKITDEEEYRKKMTALQMEADEIDLDQRKWVAEKDVQITKAQNEAKAALQQSYNELMSTSLGQSKAMLTAQKVMATAQVALNAGKAISEAVASASGGDPYTIALRIAAAVASVTATIASAYDAINSAKFATGGYVGRVSGAGSGTSDGINARLSNGEYVIRANSVNASTLPLLDAINYGGQSEGRPVSDNNYIAEQMLLALSAMPAPQVAVVDINKGQERVSVIQSNSKIV